MNKHTLFNSYWCRAILVYIVVKVITNISVYQESFTKEKSISSMSYTSTSLE